MPTNFGPFTPLRRALLGGLCLAACAAALPAHAQPTPTVTIGVQSMFGPWKTAIADKEFEKATGWKINWRKFVSHWPHAGFARLCQLAWKASITNWA